MYIKEFCSIVIELGNQAPDDSALLFIFMERLEPEVQLQIMLSCASLLNEAELVAEHADMAFLFT